MRSNPLQPFRGNCAKRFPLRHRHLVAFQVVDETRATQARIPVVAREVMIRMNGRPPGLSRYLSVLDRSNR